MDAASTHSRPLRTAGDGRCTHAGRENWPGRVASGWVILVEVELGDRAALRDREVLGE